MIEFVRIQSPQDFYYEQAFELYQISFPLHEQRPANKQACLLENSQYHFDVILNGNVFLGIVLYWHLSDFTYIEHFAIHPDHRGKALGTESIKEFCRKHKYVILEIDPPITPIAIRRAGFYQKLGFQSNPYCHKHPAYQPQFSPHSLVVMSYPALLTEAAYRLFSKELNTVVMKDADTIK